MAGLRLLVRTSSINVRKVLWTLGELGAPFVHEDDWGTPARKTTLPEFTALNPNALVPVIETEDGVLWESNTICRYLAHEYCRTDLLPAPAGARAKVEMWIDWQAAELNTAWRYAFMALVRQDPRYRNPAEIEESASRWNELMTRLDVQLAKSGPYVTGPELTLADVVLGLSAHRWEMTPIEHAELPNVRAWLGQLRSRRTAAAYLTKALP